MSDCIVLGGGITGLAAGYASGYPVYEARQAPGGICASYYMKPGDATRLHQRPAEEPAYRFEIGGGHWIFGGDPAIKRFMAELTPLQQYERHSGVYLPSREKHIPYPLQNHLHCFGDEVASEALVDMVNAPAQTEPTMDRWLHSHFGDTLFDLFFGPFHELYTAGLWKDIAPQDPYKSPATTEDVIRGAFGDVGEVGYNVEFLYPDGGLNMLMQRLAERCDVHYGKRAVDVDVEQKIVTFADGTRQSYDLLLSTLPLNRMIDMAGLATDARPDPYTSVLVLNIGAHRGAKCPDYHWVYVPESDSGFHRVGFYSNVDSDFLPQGQSGDRVSIYVERAYQGDEGQPADNEINQYASQVVEELKEWGYISEVEVLDPTWIDVAYTWAWPDSTWRSEALEVLEDNDILMVGRYGRWTFQGIADSLRDGLFVGNSVTI